MARPCGFFPVDAETLAYLRFTNRDAGLVALVEAYTKEQGLFRTDATPDPVYADTLDWIWRPSCPRWPGRSARRIASTCRT